MPIANVLRKLVAWNPVYVALVTLWKWSFANRKFLATLPFLMLTVYWFALDECGRQQLVDTTLANVMRFQSHALHMGQRLMAIFVVAIMSLAVEDPVMLPITMAMLAAVGYSWPSVAGVAPMARNALARIAPMARNALARIAPMARNALARIAPMARNALARVAPMARNAFAHMAAIARNVGDVVANYYREQVAPMARNAFARIATMARNVGDVVTNYYREAAVAQTSDATHLRTATERVRYELVVANARLHAAEGVQLGQAPVTSSAPPAPDQSADAGEQAAPVQSAAAEQEPAKKKPDEEEADEEAADEEAADEEVADEEEADEEEADEEEADEEEADEEESGNKRKRGKSGSKSRRVSKRTRKASV